MATVIAGTVGAVVVMGLLLVNHCSRKLEINVDKASWMPTGATTGCRYRETTLVVIGPPAYCFEYDIPEAQFIASVPEVAAKLQEIHGPFRVERYLRGCVRRQDYITDGHFDERAYDLATSAVIDEGLCYSFTKEDRATNIAYDRRKGRAFIYIQTR